MFGNISNEENLNTFSSLRKMFDFGIFLLCQPISSAAYIFIGYYSWHLKKIKFHYRKLIYLIYKYSVYNNL